MRVKKQYNNEVVIDLTGPQGNAFALLGLAESWAKDLSYSEDEIEDLLEDMKSSNYEHLVSVLDEHFGEYVTFME